MYQPSAASVHSTPYQPFLEPILPTQTPFVPRIDNTDTIYGYTLRKLIGKGGFGEVYLAFDNVKKQYYAIKREERKQMSQSELINHLYDGPYYREEGVDKTLFREFNLLNELSHINIIQVFDLFKTDTHWHLVMEFMDMGSIKGIINGKVLKELDVKYITGQVLNGLVFLHSHIPKPIVHRDIKGNYGLQTRAGTPSHVAPEVNLAGTNLFPNSPNSYGAPVDIWSLGCTVMEMLTGRCPNSEGYFKSIYWGNPPFDAYRPANISNNCWFFIQSCLYPDPNPRLTAYLLKGHPWQIFC
ncbi:serine/threonine-protein kinase DDB_G0283821-like isoform X2 [Mytilus edulis]|uniref:serine/threonine-protein kinase DDB_G0283821-like isoform X2 n=1 Tax=Mytilus edulis TaxID=6550 RepID=UPI0039EEF049